MSEPIIPMNGEEPETQIPENPESQILNCPIKAISVTQSTGLNSRISVIPTYKELDYDNIIEEFNDKEKLFTIDDLIDVWSRGMTNGATLWQYCQEQGYNLPVAFEAGSLELVNEVRNSKDKAQALQAMLNNNMLLLGVFTEKQ